MHCKNKTETEGMRMQLDTVKFACLKSSIAGNLLLSEERRVLDSTDERTEMGWGGG